MARIVVWRLGEALLAARLEDTLEIAGVARDGKAVSRKGHLDVRPPPGLEGPERPRRAVVVDTPDGAVALAAEEVLGIEEHRPEALAELPRWLGDVSETHVAGLVRLEDGRMAALLDVAALRPDRDGE